MHAQMPVVLDLLESVQIPLESNNTVSGLEVLSRKWVEDADTFQGFWAQRVRCDPISHGIAQRALQLTFENLALGQQHRRFGQTARVRKADAQCDDCAG